MKSKLKEVKNYDMDEFLVYILGNSFFFVVFCSLLISPFFITAFVSHNFIFLGCGMVVGMITAAILTNSYFVSRQNDYKTIIDYYDSGEAPITRTFAYAKKYSSYGKHLVQRYLNATNVNGENGAPEWLYLVNPKDELAQWELQRIMQHNNQSNNFLLRLVLMDLTYGPWLDTRLHSYALEARKILLVRMSADEIIRHINYPSRNIYRGNKPMEEFWIDLVYINDKEINKLIGHHFYEVNDLYHELSGDNKLGVFI